MKQAMYLVAAGMVLLGAGVLVSISDGEGDRLLGGRLGALGFLAMVGAGVAIWMVKKE